MSDDKTYSVWNEKWEVRLEDSDDVLCDAPVGIIYGCIFSLILWTLILAAIAAVILL